MLSRIITFISLRPYLIALAIILLLMGWMLLAEQKKQDHQQASPSNETKTAPTQVKLPKVQTTHFVAKTITKYLTLYGRSEANSRAVISAEIAGKIISINSSKGDYVTANKSIANIDKRELPARLKQAKASLSERELNYKAIKSLNDKGLQGHARLAQEKSLYLSAQTEIAQLQLALKHTHIVAPFSGILQQQFSDLGDYLQVGDPLFSLENVNPIVIRGDATEHHMSDFKLGEIVTATLLSGEIIEGKISFIAARADGASSTFRVEAEFPNPEQKILSGISAQLTIPLYQVDAIYVSPSALALDENGNLGVKLVQDGIVAFQGITLVETDNDGVWLSGFTGGVDIITLGQGFVKVGERVETVAQAELEQAEGATKLDSDPAVKTPDNDLE